MPYYKPEQIISQSYGFNTAALYSSSASAHIDTSVSVQYLEIDDIISFTRVDVPVSISLATSATANTAAMNVSAVYQLGSISGSTFTPLVGGSSTTTYTWASNSGVYSSLTGQRVMSFPLATQLTPGRYYLAIQLSTHSTSSIGTATTALRGTISPIFGTIASSATMFGDISAATNATNNPIAWRGMNSVSRSATSQTMQLSQMTMSGTHWNRANVVVYFRNV